MFTLEELNEQNYTELQKLKITKEQEHFVKNFDKCIEYQKEFPFLKIFGIKKDDIYIGLTAFARWDSEEWIPIEKRSTWFDEFFLDVKYQNKGYGHEIVKIILEKIKEIYHPKTVILSVLNDNEPAKKLYLDLGFIPTNFVYLEENDHIISKHHLQKTDEFIMYKKMD